MWKNSLELKITKLSKWGSKSAIKPYLLSLHVLCSGTCSLSSYHCFNFLWIWNCHFLYTMYLQEWNSWMVSVWERWVEGGAEGGLECCYVTLWNEICWCEDQWRNIGFCYSCYWRRLVSSTLLLSLICDFFFFVYFLVLIFVCYKKCCRFSAMAPCLSCSRIDTVVVGSNC